jgi:translation initiation factor 1
MPRGMSGTKKRVPLGDTDKSGFHSPFAQLLGGAPAPAKDGSPEGAAASLPALAAVPLETRLREVERVVVRRERKGRGGKTVTLVEGLTGLGGETTTLLLTRLRKALGCGASAEVTEAGQVLVLQGDQGDRVEVFLRGLGVKRVVRGS